MKQIYTICFKEIHRKEETDTPYSHGVLPREGKSVARPTIGSRWPSRDHRVARHGKCAHVPIDWEKVPVGSAQEINRRFDSMWLMLLTHVTTIRPKLVTLTLQKLFINSHLALLKLQCIHWWRCMRFDCASSRSRSETNTTQNDCFLTTLLLHRQDLAKWPSWYASLAKVLRRTVK